MISVTTENQIKRLKNINDAIDSVKKFNNKMRISDDYLPGQVIYNLVGNALNYVGEDKKIYVTLRIQGQQVVFSVIDHGKGIAPEDREHIWDRYFRSAESKRTKIGSGIGLSIVKGICDAHKLEYGVNSVLGEGSEFYVKFDVVQPL